MGMRVEDFLGIVQGGWRVAVSMKTSVDPGSGGCAG